MIVLAFDQPHATLIVNGEQTVVTYAGPRLGPFGDNRSVWLPSLVGQTVAIAATGAELKYGVHAQVGRVDVSGLWRNGWPVTPPLPLHHNAIVGSARVEALTVQAPFADFTPGRWAVLFTDAVPCEERCPTCRGDEAVRCLDPGCEPEDEDRHEHWIECPACNAFGHCAPIPYTPTGPIGEWTL